MSLSLFTKLMTTSRTIKESGYNLEGQLDNDDKNIELDIVEPIVRNVLTMDRSTYHTIYITTDRNIYATGYNGQGQLGIGSRDNAYSLTRVVLPSYRDIKSVTCGGYHTIFLTNSGEVYVTGYNAFGQLGLGHTDNVYTPVKLTSLSDIEEVYAGGYHTFFVTRSGDVYGCGKNDYGQLGIYPRQEIVNTPTKLITIVRPVKIACGGDYTIFENVEKPFFQGAGYNGYGQLGDGTYTNASEALTTLDPVLPEEVLNSTIEMIQCGSHHTLFLLDNRNVYGAGSNMYGQLGLGQNTPDSNTFVKINVQGIQNIVTDAYTSIFQVDTKILYGCGHNRLGELGLGDNIHRYEVTRLLYTDIWLDNLNEDIITIPELDFGKNLYIVDGYFISGVGNIVVCLDNLMQFRVFNKYSLDELDLIYFYIEKGELKYTRNRSLVFNSDGTRKYDVEANFETVNEEFLDGNTIEFTINNQLFSYNTETKELTEVFKHEKRISTSTANKYSVFGGDFIDVKTGNKVFTNYLNKPNIPKIDFQVYNLTSINILNYVYAFTYYDFDYNETYKTYNRSKMKLGFIDKDNNIILDGDSNIIVNHENIELFDINVLEYVNEKLYIGTGSGLLWVAYTYNNKTITLKMLKKFKNGSITSININDSINDLTRDLIIDTNSRYALIGFSDGRYIKYPLYKVPEIEFICTGIYFINDKVYYNIHIKIRNFNYMYHSNIRFLLHNTYNELEISLDEFDDNLELSKTVVFEKIALSTYNYLRLNYLYGNHSLGSVYQRMATIKINLIYMNERKIIANLSNYCSYDVEIILQSYDSDRDSSRDLETVQLYNDTDHQFIYFKELDKSIKSINMIARYGASDEYIISHLNLDDIDFKHLITQTGYNDEIMVDFDRLYNRLYENKIVDEVSFDLMCSLLNSMSHKKFESINWLEQYKLEKGEMYDRNGNFVPVLSDTTSNHYLTTSKPKNVRYRDHYRANIFINGLKVPYKDVQNIFDLHDGIFSSYYRDREVSLNADKNTVDITMYSESLILGEKELYTIYLDRYDNVIDKLLSVDGYDFYVPMFSDYLDSSYITVYVKFRHGVYWSRVNDKNYELLIKERGASYSTFNLKFHNQVLLKLGGEIHICVNDLDKKNEYIFKNTASNEVGRYKNYYVPLVSLNENGSLYTYYLEQSEDIEVFVDGYMLTPYVDYQVVNLPLHLQVPTMVLFRYPIDFDKKIEISIMKEQYIPAYVKDYQKKTVYDSVLENVTTNVYKQDSFRPMLSNVFDVYINGVKVPSKYNTDNRSFDMIETLKGIPVKNRIDYVRFYLEDNDFTRFLLTLFSLKLIADETCKETIDPDSGTVTKDEFYNSINYSGLEDLYVDTDQPNDGLLYLLFELVDNAFLNEESVVIDCTDKTQLSINNDVLLDGTRKLRLPYIIENIEVNANTDYSKSFYDNSYNPEDFGEE